MWRDLAPQCCVCRKRVADIYESRNDMATQDVIVTFMCHGKTEELVLPDPRALLNPARAWLDAWPKRVFLKNWARYSLAREKRDGLLE